ncbi:hypothetical protein GCM10023185_39050 [Hymenobacter saemangeumensis]|uniref:NACHT domain-containing protein n=1 Tax=Hymenobacter saemangeumensis TaxID=1084522 RepID=A0ABP8IRA2_9BACT
MAHSQPNRKKIKEIVQGLDEKSLRGLLVHLFEKIGFSDVFESHGQQELGKDIVFTETNKLGKLSWYACVVKAKNINQGDYETVVRQISECYRSKYPSSKYGRVNIDNVIVITNGVYKENAKVQIADMISEKASTTTYWQLGDIVEELIKNDLIYLVTGEGDVNLAKYNHHLMARLSSDSSIKMLESDFDVKIDSIDSFQITVRARTKDFLKEREEYFSTKNLKAVKIPINFLPDIDKIIESKKFILLHGIATSGKSTILKKVGKDMLKKDENSYVFFVELNSIYSQYYASIIDVISKQYLDATGSALNMSADGKRILILLDGLDEVPGISIREQLLAELEGIRSNSNIQVVMTSRSNDFIADNRVIATLFDKYELAPLNINEMVALGSKIINNETKTSDFIKLVKKSELIKSFPKTPLTTILLAILFKEDKIDVKELPKNITELYNKFIDVFLNKWDRNKGVSEQYKIKQKEFILQKIAEHMHLANMIKIDEAELVMLLNSLVQKHPVDGLVDAKSFLETICQRSNIFLRDSEDESFRFFHITIQEYLSSSIIGRDNEKFLVDHFLDDWWLNPNIFYAGSTPYQSNVLKQVAQFKILPVDADGQFAFIIHASKVLQAAHLLPKDERTNVLKSMIYIFDKLQRATLQEVINATDIRFQNKTMLDMVLWARKLFMEFFSSKQFEESLTEIHEQILSESAGKHELTDITVYCISLVLSINQKSDGPLMNFYFKFPHINSRWSRIIDVDINIKKLKVNNEKKRLLLKAKRAKNKEYINSQFKDRLKHHLNSITGFD